MSEILDIRSLIANGINHSEFVETEIGQFEIRPLSMGEKAEIEAMGASGLKTSAKADGRNPNMDAIISIDMSAIKQAENEARFKTLAYGLSTKNKTALKVEDIKKLVIKEEVIEQVYKRICEISELNAEGLLPFREITSKLSANYGDLKRDTAGK